MTDPTPILPDAEKIAARLNDCIHCIGMEHKVTNISGTDVRSIQIDAVRAAFDEVERRAFENYRSHPFGDAMAELRRELGL